MVAQKGVSRALAHGIESELPATALQDAKAEQDADGAYVSHQEIQETGAADFRNAVLRGHQKVRAEGHRLPCHHEEVGIVGEYYRGHTGKKYVVLQAKQPGRGALPRSEVTGRKG